MYNGTSDNCQQPELMSMPEELQFSWFPTDTAGAYFIDLSGLLCCCNFSIWELKPFHANYLSNCKTTTYWFLLVILLCTATR